MSSEDFAALETATGAEAARLFLEQMVIHHEGAIDMAETEASEGANSAAIEMAEAIIATQTAEVQDMQGILASLCSQRSALPLLGGAGRGLLPDALLRVLSRNKGTTETLVYQQPLLERVQHDGNAWYEQAVGLALG